MIRFMKDSLWDMLLCTILIFACSTCVFSGFYVPESQVTSYAVTIAASALLVLLLTAASYDRRSIIIGLGALLLVFAGMIAVSAAGGSSVFADSEDNPLLRFLLLLITAVVIFAASRFRVGAVLLLPAGTIALCLVEFMYETWHIVCLLLFLTACAAMIIYRNYIHNVIHSRTLKTAQTSALAYGLALCLLVMGIGAGVFYGVIDQMHPPVKELKIITKYLSLEVLEKIGVADTELIEDPDLTTDQQDDRQDTTQQDSENKDDTLNDSASDADDLDSDEGNAPDQMDKHFEGPFSAIRYDWGIPLWVIYTVLALLVIAAAVTLKLLLRRRWFRKVQSLPPKEQVSEMYAFFLRKLRLLKVFPVTGETPMEFARRNALRLQMFRTDDLEAAGFPELTGILMDSEYGDHTPGTGDIRQFESFYRVFYRNCREYLGKVQYMIKFFIL